jgi:uncharacterized coiled-coil protein SlyX
VNGDEARIADLESRLTLADHAIGELSDEVYRQQQQISALEAAIERLIDQLKRIEATQTDERPRDDIPPHY